MVIGHFHLMIQNMYSERRTTKLCVYVFGDNLLFGVGSVPFFATERNENVAFCTVFVFLTWSWENVCRILW